MEENLQQFFLFCSQILANLPGAGVSIGPNLSIGALGASLHGRGLTSDITFEVLPARLELRQCLSGADLAGFRQRLRREWLGLSQGCTEAK